MNILQKLYITEGEQNKYKGTEQNRSDYLKENIVESRKQSPGVCRL